MIILWTLMLMSNVQKEVTNQDYFPNMIICSDRVHVIPQSKLVILNEALIVID